MTKMSFAGRTSLAVTLALLVGSLTATLLATVVLRARNRVYRRIHELERDDSDADGIPDVYQRGHDDG